MPKKCAFCPQTSNRSGEHIWSAWISKLFAGTKTISRKQFAPEAEVKQWVSIGFDHKAKVVCRKCNNEWMNDLETLVKPCIKPLILSANPVTITPECITAITAYAFKAAVIGDHMLR